ncbi:MULTISPECIES: hypothetical protein [Pseudoalteromonas]|jgi:hypothetical protein|uniref:Uncharacterized protein n=1 Tax=Pseudoalteromonas agarivorans DSM 14585 TaxID=1312369 RepID=A0ACA8E1Q5_9GAMM|nr:MULTISPECIES: hypothetical protein [Pseudoalteromonas]ATC84170.1 hypothetical protein PAGA_b0218 [Pseudoalteromonas agarivorans DSM 14585]MDC9501536.1 hypothetical protein [Pseudoalteromonas sp. Angola-18]MDC9524074.1 hypothetical protein [Pseudoalteromonas sp. Angola-30]MDC9530786.1 hypothetical protein [Pseudoalteromonas sp. Angola-7]|tara:strand:+ start:225 stop:395 length:171 start_codon:yes stop_codon:yes gene_type:complete
MKALLGSLAKKIKGDPLGSEQLRAFISSGSKDSEVITLSNGKKYRVSTSPKDKAVA